jgi:RNA polymerase sigma factor (sigma-70 family)
MEAELEVLERPVNDTLSVRDKFFEETYESVFPAVALFVQQMNGSYQDAKDIFQDALIIYFERLSENSLTITISPERYILGIAKHLWLRKFKDDRKKIALDDFERALYVPEDFFPSVRTNRVLQFVEAAGTKCLDLLRSFYFEKLALKDIATKFGYGSEHSVSVQKYKCLENVRDAVKQKSVTYEDFFE